MRLTLRTLLAYLDNTLDPEDVAILRSKLEESGFATQLVHRIRESLNNTGLSAPPPDSVHPIGEANVISEYLDSTLTAEQIAEIERACLESEQHLAEAAACHQILTMVLGTPAAVSDELRQRIYALPDAVSGQPPRGSFSAVSIPNDDAFGPAQEQLPTGDSMPQPAGKTVQPVGLDDSGVSDAPTRLREAGTIGDDSSLESDAAVAGSDARGHLQVSDVYSGTIRPSRIAPWLVSLALAGVLLFVLTQIFAPLLNKTAKSDPIEKRVVLTPKVAAENTEEIEESPAETPTLESEETPAANTQPLKSTEPNEAESADEEMTSPAAGTEDADASDADTSDADTSDADTSDADSTSAESPPKDENVVAVESPEVPATPSEAAETVIPKPEEMPAEKSDSVSDADVPAPIPDDPPMVEKVAGTDADMPPTSEALEKPADPEMPEDPAAPAAEVVPLATGTTDATLLVARVGQHDWVRVGKDTLIGEQVTLVNAPGFRSPMVTANGEMVLTMIGATRASWIKDPDGGELAGVNVEFGGALITAKQADVTTKAILGDHALAITLTEPETVAGVEVRYFRAPGMDPSDPENHLRVARIFSVQGNIQLQTETGSQALETGQQWMIRGEEVAPVAAMKAVPTWVDPPDDKAVSIDSEARNGLLQLIVEGEPLMLALSEATSFRRAEVGALAAQTMLLMGNGSPYFGGDGLLSNLKQRSYWPEHFLALRSVADFSPDSAAALATSITEMDAANGKTLFRLLIGYSQKQLVEGGDEALIDLLESNSMAVRVLAIENLRAITGTTLYYRPEEDSEVRRTQATKKWRTRQRKGDIRWNAEE